MAELLHVYMTEEIGPVAGYDVLTRHLKLGAPKIIHRRSAEVLPQYFQFMGSSGAWLPLAAAAAAFLTGYLTKLGQLAAEGTVKVFNSLRSRDGAEPLVDVAEAIVQLRKSLGRNGSVVVGIPLQNEYYGAVLRISSDDPLVVGIQLSTFVNLAPELERAMREEVGNGRAPLGNAIVSVEDDGRLRVEWMDQAMSGKHTRYIGFPRLAG